MNDPMHIVCPQCHATNRIPAMRLKEHPKCGKCHQALFMGAPISLDRAGFMKHLKNDDIPLLVDFWAPWCGPCRMMAPYFVEAARRLEPNFRLIKIDTEAEPELGAQWMIRSIPTLAIFKAGEEIARQAGAMGTADIIAWAEANGS